MTGDSVRETLDEIVAVRHGPALDPRRNPYRADLAARACAAASTRRATSSARRGK